MSYVTLVIYYDKDSKTSSFLHSEQRAAVNKQLADFFQKKGTIKTNPIWLSAEVPSSDRVTVAITMDRAYGTATFKEGVQEIFEQAPSLNKEGVQRTVVVHF